MDEFENRLTVNICLLLIREAEVLIQRGLELMTLEELSQWEGVRSWQERVGSLYEEIYE